WGPGLPGLLPQGRTPGDRQRRPVGPFGAAEAGDPGAPALRDRRLLQRARLHRADRGQSRCLGRFGWCRAGPARWGGPGWPPLLPTATSSWPGWSTWILTEPKRRPATRP